ncbi:MAG TPA: aminopeptidase P N-terminal domain-containing protein [Myxococcota bacterium]|nr:aminopeptidase P N-terminal domain-containing protein [Myxococcota bacterium]
MHAERRRRFLDAMGPDAVAILLGANLVTRSADTEFPFRQDSDFWYLTGFGHPHAAAVLRTDGGPPYTLFVEPRDRAAETWTGYRPGVEGAVAEFGANEAHTRAELLARLPELVRKASRLFHVLGRDATLDQKLVGTLDEMRLRSRAGYVPASEIVDPRSILHEMRLRKGPEELAVMRRASDITAEAHRDAARLARGGRYEYELEAALNYAFRRRGAAGPAYSTIVGGGRNATVLHYVTNDQPLREGELVLIDAGCELEGYASDVTRTYPVGGRFEGAARDVYEVVLAAQRRALEAVRPGTTLAALHAETVRALVEGMISLGLLQGDPDELVAREAYRPWYMHNTSHWLGLDVHDVGAYRLGGEPRALEPGMVFTIEPGLYVRADDETAPERLRGIGVRIEDDVVVTEGGCENLTAAIPKAPGDVEAWMRAA